MTTNLIIIGAGPAGEAAAKIARGFSPNGSITVTLVEKEEAGGLCLNKGCVPSKALLEEVRKRVQAGLPINWAEIQQAKNNVVETIRAQLEGSLKTRGVRFVKGYASFKDNSSIEVRHEKGTDVLPFDKAIITAGTESLYPPPFDAYADQLLNSDKMLDIEKTPASLVIVGGGAVGCEFACLLNAAGSKVTLIEMTPGLLPGEDRGVASTLARIFEQRGIQIKTGVRVSSLKKGPDGWELSLTAGDPLKADQILVCVGRTPSISALGLLKANIKSDKKSLTLSPHLQTSNPHVYAAGDVAGTRLAHAAAAQGEVAALNALGQPKTYDDRFVPRCLYTWPEVASVGAWKYQLEEKNAPVRADRAFFKASAKAWAAQETDGFVQIVSDAESGQILGAQIIGAHATELIHIFSVALKKEMTRRELGDVMFAHPTLSEVVKEAAKK